MPEGRAGERTAGEHVLAGERLFARYAYAPNARGYCGPPEGAVLEAVARGQAGAADVDVRAVARRFSGAWPYQLLIAELAGIADPLDEAVVRAYWTGNALTREIDRRAFGDLLLARFASQAGHYWQHLDASLLGEVAPTHAFHVLGVYPWSRLLAGGRPEPVTVLDSCRIRPGEVVDVCPGTLRVRAAGLVWDGRRLSLASAAVEEVGCWPEIAAAVRPGATVAIHWNHACDVLSPQDRAELDHWTAVQVDLTNRRLARG